MLSALGLAVVLALLWAVGSLAAGERRMPRLGAGPLPEGAALPAVSVVIAARDEARGIAAALRSVLAQDHPRLEVIVVDDRSSDGTGDILARMAAEDARLRVLRVDALPPGWLGKNHALHLGAASAGGELLLFTDADVVMRPDAVRRAAAHLRRAELDHLTLAPRIVMQGWLLEAFGVWFGVLFALFTRPWRVHRADDPAHVGIGAFNLIRAEAYRSFGGHRPIRMRPDDDVKLGKLVKRHRLRQGFAIGTDLLAVEWYRGVREAVRGLRKNAFAGVDYRLPPLVLATATQLLFVVWPFVAVAVLGGPARWIHAAAVGLVLVLYAGAARQQRLPLWRGIAAPAAALLFVVIIWNSAIYTLRRGGIEWRGTHYPLDALRANRV